MTENTAPKRRGRPPKAAAQVDTAQAAEAAEAPQKAKMGRPTKYTPEIAQQVFEYMSQGYSLDGAAGFIGISHDNMYRWAGQYSDFSAALSRAKQLEQIHWEQMGLQGMFADKFNAMVWKTSMQARFREDYTERKVQELTGKDGGAIQTEVKASIDATALDPDARATLRAALKAAKGNE